MRVFQCPSSAPTVPPTESVYVTGNNDELGNWSPVSALKLDPENYPTWNGTFTMPANASIEWKCIKRSETDPDSQIVWQPGANNLLQTGESGATASTSGSF